MGKPQVGADCSNSTQKIYKEAGFDYKNIVANAYPHSGVFGEVADPQPGDVVWWWGAEHGHVAIYAGNGMMWTAHQPGGAVYNRNSVKSWETTVFKRKAKYYRLKTDCKKGVLDKIWNWIKNITK